MVSFFSNIADLNERLTGLVQSYSSVFVLCDENTEIHCLPLIRDVLAIHVTISIHSGEQYKNLQTCEQIWTILTGKNADRKSLLINLGGGVITDMGGFAASCYKRGIDFINIPTTLLAMVDASVGGKTGIDFYNFKNQIGLFSEAKQVLISDIFLKTLDERQTKSGMAEVIKHYLIADRKAFLAFPLERTLPEINMIKNAVAIKSKIVDADPLEKGERKKLNFGHTIGHALESYRLSTVEPLLHGEAIVYGMIVETYISVLQSLITEEKAQVIFKILKEEFSMKPLTVLDIEHILNNVVQDKKNDNNIIKMALIDDIGSCMIDVAVTEEEIKKAIELFNQNVNE